MRVTMNDIATKLNISVNTVSKALSGKTKVSEEMRNRIIETAKQMGYVKNQYAARLATTPLKIGVVICGYDKNYYKYTIDGINKAFASLSDGNIEFETVVYDVDKTISEKVFEKLTYFENKHFDGIIINDFHSPLLSARIADLRESGMEVVLLNYDIKESNRSFSVTNNYSVSSRMAAELMAISLKYSDNKNVLIGSICEEAFGQNELCRNFKEAAEEFGLHIVSVAYSNEELIKEITPDTMGIYITHAKSLDIIRKIDMLDFSPMLIVSDLYEDMIPYIESGTVTATVYQNPIEQAYNAVMKLYKVLLGTEERKDIIIKPQLLFKSNYPLFF